MKFNMITWTCRSMTVLLALSAAAGQTFTSSAGTAGPLAEATLPVIGFGATAYAAEPVNDTYPWVNVNRHFGASIRSGRVLAVTPNPAWGLGMSLKDGGVYMYGSDVSGWVASIDGAHTFDNANSGRVFSNNICGGYTASWYSEDGDTATAAKCYADAPLALRPFAEGGPPSALVGFTGLHSQVNSVSSGPAPAELNNSEVQSLCKSPTGAAGCASDVIYAANNAFSYFSPDAGRQWFPVSPSCELKRMVAFSSIAADRGKPGHVVALASDYLGTGQFEASGCSAKKATTPYGPCAVRTIAYTDNVGEELKESILATKLTGGNTAPNGKMRFERAGGGGAEPDTADLEAWKAKAKWRYATINNLPAPVAVGGTCAIGIGLKNAAGKQGWVVGDTCPAHPDHHCHGRKSKDFKQGSTPVDRNAWCLDPAEDECKCITGSSEHCRYPTPTHLEIDPRNGWAYLSTDVGLLASPDGGGHWIRQGGGPGTNPADEFNDFLGARLYTHRFHGTLTEDPTPANSLDLNANSARIQFVGHVSLAFTSCGNGVKYDNGRDRGHLVATVPVRWNRADPGQPAVWATGVFIASARADCETATPRPSPGALEFWDSAHLWLDGLANQHPDKSDYQLKAWGAFDKAHPKLLNSLPFAGNPQQFIHFTAAAVAPSDPRVIWAWSYAVSSKEGGGLAVDGAAAGHLLWRSLDGGGSWHVALPGQRWVWPARAGRSGGGIHLMAQPVLSVAPNNPHKVVVSAGYQGQVGSGADAASDFRSDREFPNSLWGL